MWNFFPNIYMLGEMKKILEAMFSRMLWYLVVEKLSEYSFNGVYNPLIISMKKNDRCLVPWLTAARLSQILNTKIGWQHCSNQPGRQFHRGGSRLEISMMFELAAAVEECTKGEAKKVKDKKKTILSL